MPLREISNACVRFGGLQALVDFSFTLDPGELVALIGPNGAGKTTAFNIVTGVYAPASGTIELAGKRIDGSKPAQINHAGIARTFQNIRLFSRMTVLDNVMVGFNRSAERGLLGPYSPYSSSTRPRNPRNPRSFSFIHVSLATAPVTMLGQAASTHPRTKERTAQADFRCTQFTSQL